MDGPQILVTTEIAYDKKVYDAGRSYHIRVPLEPGSLKHSLRLYLTVYVSNHGKGTAFNIEVDNPIPPGTVYSIGSALAETGELFCSSDHGVSFHSERDQLTAIKPCTDIRWLVDRIDPNTQVGLTFEVIVQDSTLLPGPTH